MVVVIISWPGDWLLVKVEFRVERGGTGINMECVILNLDNTSVRYRKQVSKVVGFVYRPLFVIYNI